MYANLLGEYSSFVVFKFHCKASSNNETNITLLFLPITSSPLLFQQNDAFCQKMCPCAPRYAYPRLKPLPKHFFIGDKVIKIQCLEGKSIYKSLYFKLTRKALCIHYVFFNPFCRFYMSSHLLLVTVLVSEYIYWPIQRN